jgi:ComF family protein
MRYFIPKKLTYLAMLTFKPKRSFKEGVKVTVVNPLERVLNLILPVRCALCSTYLQAEIGLCANCQAKLGAPKLEGNIVHLGVYRGHLERAVRALKFGKNRNVAVPLGRRLAQGVQEADWKVDAIVPIPLFVLRQQTRGYNQARELAKSLASALDVQKLEALRRVKSTKRQAKLGKTQRSSNVREAFEVVGNVRGLELVLVDDVYTSGATATECALALIEAGAKRVRIAVISRVLESDSKTKSQ